MPSSGKITLSPKQAKAYQFLLNLDSTGKKQQFSVEAITGKLTEKFGNGGNLLTMLKAKGLLIRSKSKGEKRGPNVTTVVRRTFELSGSSHQAGKKPAKQKPTVIKASPKKQTKAGGSTTGPSTRSDNELAGHHEFFLQHQAVLAEADRRRARLQELRYEIVIHDGEALLRYTGHK